MPPEAGAEGAARRHRISLVPPVPASTAQPVTGLTPLQALVRRPGTTALLLLLGGLLGLLLPGLRQGDPVATVVVLLSPQAVATGTDVSPGQVTSEQADLASLSSVRLAAATAAQAQDPQGNLDVQQLRRRLVVTVPTGTQTLAITFRAPKVAAARAGAEAAAAAYVRIRSTQVVQQASRTLRDLDRLERALPTGPVDALAQARADLAQRRAAAVLAQTLPDSEVGTVLPVSTSHELPSGRGRGALAGLIAGLFPALVVGHRAESSRARQHSAKDARSVLDAPNLGTVVTRRRDSLPVRDDAGSSAAGAYSGLAGALGLHWAADVPAPVVAVVDGTRSGGWSGVVLANLALAIVDEGRSVLVVSRRGGTARRLLAGQGRRVSRPQEAPSDARQGIGLAHPMTDWGGATGWSVTLVEAPGMLAQGIGAQVVAQATAALVVVPRRLATSRLDLLQRRLDDLDVRCLGYVHVRSTPLAGLRRPKPAARLRPAVGLRVTT